MSVLNLIPGSGMGKVVPYEAGFPGSDDEVQGVIVVWTMTFPGLWWPQTHLMSVLLNAH